MAAVALNDVPVIEGYVVFSLQGRWVAELSLQGTDPEAVSGPVVLDIGGVLFRGSSSAAKDRGHFVTATVVGGAGGLDVQVTPQHYTSVTVRTVVGDALAVGGEKLSDTSSSSILDTFLVQWTTVRGSAADALKAVLGPLGATYRVEADGRVWVGLDSFPVVEHEHVVEAESPAKSKFRIAIESGAVLPGLTFLGKRVREVVYEIDSARIRADVVYGEKPDDERAAQRELIRQDTAKFDFHAPYLVRVVAQNADGTVEVSAADPRLPSSMSKVPVRTMPGVTSVKIPTSSWMVLQFANGEPAKPFVTTADQTPNMGLTITSTGTVDLAAPEVKCGGSLALAKANELLAWAPQVVAAIAALGGSCPPLSPTVATTVTKGA